MHYLRWGLPVAPSGSGLFSHPGMKRCFDVTFYLGGERGIPLVRTTDCSFTEFASRSLDRLVCIRGVFSDYHLCRECSSVIDFVFLYRYH